MLQMMFFSLRPSELVRIAYEGFLKKKKLKTHITFTCILYSLCGSIKHVVEKDVKNKKDTKFEQNL